MGKVRLAEQRRKDASTGADGRLVQRTTLGRGLLELEGAFQAEWSRNELAGRTGRNSAMSLCLSW